MDKSEYVDYPDLLDLMKKNGKYDLKLIDRAYKRAYKSHGEQKRHSGIPYIFHPISVAYILVELGMDSQTIAAALLHDVLEDTISSFEELKKEFGEEIARLVEGVTKFRHVQCSSKEEQNTRNIKKMLIAMSQDIRVIIIKLADRLNNMRTIACMPDFKRRTKSLENMEVFVPIAHRLGIRSVKEELEDLSLKYLDPVAYKEIEQSLALRKKDREKFIELIKKRITDRIQEFVPNIYIEGRIKSSNGIYRKMFMKGKMMDEIYDIYAVRVIVNTVNDCYNILGIVHDMFQPIPNRFKDYISIPKPNMYQSLHTTVLSKEGIPFEIQIRTWDMNRTAEYGIAAHWKYKLDAFENKESLEKCLSWIKRMVDDEKEEGESADIVGNIKLDLAPEEVFVLTPKGKAVTLPAGATVIDFAYAIHTEIGNRMIGAKVDKRIVPIDYIVKTGEIVEIITTKEVGRGPSRDWIKLVKTSEAKSKIRQWFKREKREENIIEGKAEVEKEFRRNNIILSDEELVRILEPVLKRNQCMCLNDFYASVGYGGLQLWRVMPRIKEEYSRTKGMLIQTPKPLRVAHKSNMSGGVMIEGMDNCLVKFSKCCNPVPGDSIAGFITRGYGVSIHKTECKNVPKGIYSGLEPERWVRAKWIDNAKGLFRTTLEVLSLDNGSVLADITRQLSNMRIGISELSSHISSSDQVTVLITFKVRGHEQINSVITVISRIDGVISVRRV